MTRLPFCLHEALVIRPRPKKSRGLVQGPNCSSDGQVNDPVMTVTGVAVGRRDCWNWSLVLLMSSCLWGCGLREWAWFKGVGVAQTVERVSSGTPV